MLLKKLILLIDVEWCLFYLSRMRFNSVSVEKYDAAFLRGAIRILQNYNSTLGDKPGAFLFYTLEPFSSKYFDYSQGGAYPHFPSPNPLYPTVIWFGWELPLDDDAFVNGIISITKRIKRMAIANGQNIGGSKQILYPNYAMADTPLKNMYGENLKRLRKIRKAWDPKNIMYLTGGFKF